MVECQISKCSTETQKLPPGKQTRKVCKNRKPSSRRAGKKVLSQTTQASKARKKELLSADN